MGTKEWIDQIRSGDLEAFNRFVNEHQDAVYRLAYYLLCDELSASRLTESVFQKAFREARSYRGGSARFWLYSLVVRLYLHEFASRNDRSSTLSQSTKTTAINERSVQKMLAALPPEQRLALALVDVEGLDYPQAASIAGWPVSTISSKLAQARQTFANLASSPAVA